MVPSRLPESRRAPGGVLLRTAALFLAVLAFSTGLRAAEARAEQPKIAASAMVQMQALQSIKTSKSVSQKKIGSRLYLGLLHQRGDARLAPLKAFRFVRPEPDGRVPVEVIVRSANGIKPVFNKLESLGAVVWPRTYAALLISARVRLEDLETLAAMPEVKKVRQSIPMLTHKINTSEGDKTHGAQQARLFYGITGAGVKVGVMSDGVDSLATVQASGDLPPVVQVLPGQAGLGDEGTAMLEIVHDLAPGAALVFATANPNQAQFAQNILDLAAAGCNVIVDDVIYLDESPFEDGAVAQAVNTVTAAGVLYFSSAGNEGNKDDGTSGTWEGDFLASGAALPPLLVGTGVAHDFGDGGQSILVTAADSNTAILIWAEHYNLTDGFASTDFDLYDMDGALTDIFDASTEAQDGIGGDDFPVEFIPSNDSTDGLGVFTGERLVVMKFAAGATSSVPMFNLIVFRGQLVPVLATNGATRGHSAAVAAFSVAATPAAASFDGITPAGPYPGLFTAANASESFTSDGPRRIILDGVTGNELTPGNRTSTGGVVRQKPDITAADGVSCATPGFNPFYGTSAAAPHAAAIAALIKAAVPASTPAQVRTALVSSAIDIEAAGVDRDTGAGIVMAGPALAAAGAAPGAFLSAGAPVPTQFAGDGDAFVEPNEIWNLKIPLTNAGGAQATAINAVLSSPTAGVTIQSAASAYPNIAAGATRNNLTLFRFFVGPTVPCGSVIQFVLTVTYTGSTISPQTFNFSVKTGSPGAPVTFSYAGPVVPIEDGTGISGNSPGAVAVAVLPVSGVVGSLYKVVLRIDGTSCDTTDGSTTVGIDHSFVSDLQITLRSPAGTPVLVIKNTGEGGNNFCQTVLDDAGGTSVQTLVESDAPFTGTFSPNEALAGFSGESPNGNWQLEAQDFFQFDTGNIRAFSLIISPAVCNAPALFASVAASKTVAGSFAVGSNVAYTVTLNNSGTGATTDNPGDEFTDVLPATLALVSASASSGTAVATLGTNTVTWNGAIPASGSVTITITATVLQAALGLTVSNQGTVSYDADLNGTNETTVLTNDPSTPTGGDPTSFVAGAALPVPTLSTWALLVLASGLVFVALRRLW